MSVHNFYLKLFIFTAINHLHGYSIKNIKHDNDNSEYSIESIDDAPKKRNVRHQIPEIDEEITEKEDFDLRKEIRREIMHRIIEKRLRDHALDEERPERITNRRSNGNRWKSRFQSSNDEPFAESELGGENRRNGDVLNRVWLGRNNIDSVVTNFNSKWRPSKIEPDHTKMDKLDINTLLYPEKYSITGHRWKPNIIDSAYVDSGKMNVDNLLDLQNKGTTTHNRWKNIQVKPDNNLGKLDINTLMERDNQGTVTMQRWRPIRIYNHPGKVNRNNLLDLDNKDSITNNKWELIKAETDGDGKIKIHDWFEPKNDKIYFDKDINNDLTVLTDKDIKNIKLAIELDWRNVNKDELIEIFRSYWYKLIVMVEELKEINDQIQTGYLLWLLETMKDTVINNPEYLNIYLQSHNKELQDHNKSDSQKVNHPLKFHEIPTNKLTIDMPPPKGLIKKICEGVNQNVEDFWKIFYSYFGKEPTDKENLLYLEKLYMILTIFTQFNKAQQLGLPIEQYVDEIIKIIEPDIHSLGPILNTETEPGKQNLNTPCISCTGNKIKNIVNDWIEKEKLPGEKVKIVPIIPYGPKYVPKEEHKWHAPGQKDVGIPTTDITKPVPDTIYVEAKTVKPIVDTNKYESETSKPLPIKEPEHFIEIKLPTEKNTGVWQNKDDIHKNYPDTTFVKPVPDGNIEDSDIKGLPYIDNLQAKPVKPMPDRPIPNLDYLDTETAKPITDLDIIDVKPINTIVKPPHHMLDLEDKQTKPKKPQPILGTTEEITVQPTPELNKPNQDLDSIIEKPVKAVSDTDDSRPTTIIPFSDLDKIKEIIMENIPHLYDPKEETIKPIPDLKPAPDSDDLPKTDHRIPESDKINQITVETKPNLQDSKRKPIKPLEDLLNKDVIKPAPGSDPRDNNMKPITDKDRTKEIILETVPDLNKHKVKTIDPEQNVNIIDDTPVKTVPNSDNLHTMTAKPFSELDNIEKITVGTTPDINNMEPDIGKPLQDLLNIDVIKPIPDSREKNIKPLPNKDKITVETTPDIINMEPDVGKPLQDLLNIDVIKPIPDSRDKNIIVDAAQDVNKPEIEIIYPMQDVDKVYEKPFKPITDSNRIKDKPIKQTPDSTSFEGSQVNTTPGWSNLPEKPVNQISDVEVHTINPIPDSGNKEIKPFRPDSQINVPEHEINKQPNKHIHHILDPNTEGDTLKPLEKLKNILKPHVFEKIIKPVEPIPHLIDLPLTNVSHENKEITEDLDNVDPNLKAKIINLKKHHPDLSIEDIKNIIQQGKPIPELDHKNDVDDNLQVISPADNIHELEVEHPNMIKDIQQNKKVPKPQQDNEYVAPFNADNWSNLPEMDNQILSKDITSNDKNNIKGKVPGIDKTYDYVVKKRPLHPKYDVVDVHDPKNKQVIKIIDPERETSVDLISKDSLDLLTNMIIVYLKRLLRNLGFDGFITSINFDFLISSLMKILLIILKALTANGVPIQLIMKVVMEIQDKLRLFQSAELQECLRQVSSVVIDIITSVVAMTMQYI